MLTFGTFFDQVLFQYFFVTNFFKYSVHWYHIWERYKMSHSSCRNIFMYRKRWKPESESKLPGTTFLRIALYLICTKVCKGPEINDGWRHKLTDSFEIDDSLEPFYQQLTSALFTHSERYLIIFDRLHYSGASSTPRRNQFFIQYTPQMRRLAKRPKNSTFRQSSHSGSKQTRRKTKKKRPSFFLPTTLFDTTSRSPPRASRYYWVFSEL